MVARRRVVAEEADCLPEVAETGGEQGHLALRTLAEQGRELAEAVPRRRVVVSLPSVLGDAEQACHALLARIGLRRGSIHGAAHAHRTAPHNTVALRAVSAGLSASELLFCHAGTRLT